MPKIPDYTGLTTPDNNDLLVIEDSVAGSTKNITREDFLSGAPLPADTVDTQAILDANVTTPKLADTSVTNLKMGLTTTSWTPTITPQGAMTYTTVTTVAWYADFGSFYYIAIRSEGTTGGTASIGFNITNLPFALDTNEQALVGIADAGANDSGYAQSISGTELAIRRPAGANWNLGAGRGFIISGILKKA